MKPRCIPLAGFCFFLLAVVTGPGQKRPVQPETARFGIPTGTARALESYIYGVIKKIDIKSNELVLEKTKFGIDQTFKLEPKTKYIHDGKPATSARLKVGDQVYVDVKKDKKTGEMLAKKVISGVSPTELP